MNTHNEVIDQDTTSLAEDVRSLVAATSHMAEEKTSEARKRLTAALDRGSKIIGEVEQTAAHGVRCADRALRENPYPTIISAFSIGVLLGHLSNRQ